jgi:hypothetical protein
VTIDVADALYPDTVFDPFGLAGDNGAKALQIDTPGDTGATIPASPYLGSGGTAGYEGIELTFDQGQEGGFDPGETVGFSVDMDPNSVQGFASSDLNDASVPRWDVGGVSGAELLNASVRVAFADGSEATGELFGDGSQAGAQALISQAAPTQTLDLTVNGVGAGDGGTYDADNPPTVIVNGPAGATARIVMTKGFIQPVDGTIADTVAGRLDGDLFEANNAAEFQTSVDVSLTGGDQDVSSLFDYFNILNSVGDFAGSDQLDLGFVAAVVDPSNDHLPLGPVADPVYVAFDDFIN